MRALILTLFMASSLSILSQTIYVKPTGPILVPVGTVQSVTSYVAGINDKTVTWTTTGGTFRGTNPCIVNEPCIIGLDTTGLSAGNYTVTATTNSGTHATATSVITVTAAPTPLTTHPRLGVTAAMLSALQAKAVAGNPMYQAIRNQAIAFHTADNSIWSWSCGGGTGGSTGLPNTYSPGYEFNAYYYAWMALADPGDPTYNWGCYARDEWVYTQSIILSQQYNLVGNPWSDHAVYFAFTEDWLIGAGALSAGDQQIGRQFAAYITPTLLTYFYGITPPTSGYNTPALTANSINSMRTMGNNYTMSKLLYVASAGTTFNDTTPDDPLMGTNGALAGTVVAGGSGCAVGNTNSIGGGTGGVAKVIAVSGGVATEVIVITSGSGYSVTTETTAPVTGSCTGLTIALTLLGNTCGATRYNLCNDNTGGSLHAYLSYLEGSMLYLDWAHLEDPNVSQQAYQAAYANIPTQPTCLYIDGTTHQCFGDGRDGQSSEGSWYQYSMYRLRYALNILITSGYDSPSTACLGSSVGTTCPQLSLANSSWWDMKYINDLSMLTAMAPNNGPNPGGASPAFNYLTTGDSNTYYKSVADMYTEATMLSTNFYTGRTDSNSALLWAIMNVAYGGPAGTAMGCTTWCGFDFALTAASSTGVVDFDLMLSLPATDPVVSPPADPRPSLPTDVYEGSYSAQQFIRSGWTSTDSLVSFYCTNTLIDHEHEFCGRFDIFDHGEYITKGSTEFDDYNDSMSTSIRQNELSLINTTGTGCNPVGCFVYPAVAYGGPWWHGEQQGFMPMLHSELPAYSAFSSDDTVAYNGWFVFNIPFDIVSYNDVQKASRDAVYIRSLKEIFYYDRGTTGAASDKNLSINTTGAPTISGNSATWTTRSGNQKASYTTFLSGAPSITDAKLPNSTTITATFTNIQNGSTQQYTCTGNNADGTTTNLTSSPFVQWSSSATSVGTISSTGLFTTVGLGTTTITCLPYGLATNATANVISGSSAGPAVNVTGDTQQFSDWEPYTRLNTDAGSVTNTTFGSVVAWGPNPGFTPPTVTAVTSSSGQVFDGALVGTNLVMFFRNPTAFTGVTYPASGATTQFLTNLVPNSTYPITGTGTPGTAVSDSAGVLTFSAAGSGNITVGTAAPPTLPAKYHGKLHSGGKYL